MYILRCFPEPANLMTIYRLTRGINITSAHLVALTDMTTDVLSIIPVLPSADIARDVAWYEEKTGFKVHFSDKMYAILYRNPLYLHLKWYTDTPDNPLSGSSVIRNYTKNVKPLFDEYVEKGTITQHIVIANTH